MLEFLGVVAWAVVVVWGALVLLSGYVLYVRRRAMSKLPAPRGLTDREQKEHEWAETQRRVAAEIEALPQTKLSDALHTLVNRGHLALVQKRPTQGAVRTVFREALIPNDSVVAEIRARPSYDNDILRINIFFRSEQAAQPHAESLRAMGWQSVAASDRAFVRTFGKDTSALDIEHALLEAVGLIGLSPTSKVRFVPSGW